ncbi:uncharacterized protein [Littorina saxatilis]|uniref:uncharacterized protein n=1 Tax=Littorina saxatilis TaxID=31220 RepID=UPI0038B68474
MLEVRVFLLFAFLMKTDTMNPMSVVATQMNFRQISFISFYRVWKQQCPYIAIMKPSTDLCQKCQHFFHSLRQGCRLEEEDKAALLAAYSEHVQQSKGQRDHYRQQCLAAKQVYGCMEPQQGPATPCSKNVTMHYSWDFAQQVHLPHHAQQVGPIYFKTPRKIDVFGVCCEGSGKQVFYLVDEAESTGKGANEVISMVHHYFDTHSFGEKAAQIHFDNCGGQNKNNAVLWYALWRVMTGRHETFSYNCTIVGHTKFDPDWHFGLWKVKWRRSTSECMNDVVESVRRSTRQSHNLPQVCKDPHHPVVFFNWKEYLGKLFRPLLGISKFHHFRTTSAEPGVVYYRDLWDSPELKVNLLKKNVILPGPAEMPEALPTPGMSAEREWYLYQEIRTFCACPEKSDEICPRPTLPRPSTSKKMKIE